MELISAIQEREKTLFNNLTREQLIEHIRRLGEKARESINIIEPRYHHNPYKHGEQITKYARNLARHLKCSQEDIEIICYAARLHDIGKEEISKEILNKPAQLTESEYEIIKKHPLYGQTIVNPLIYIGTLIRHHHERYDGKGYPDGLKGDKIPLGSRIISIIDAYSAMTHFRPYKKPLSKKNALEEIKRCSGTQFDPQIVDVFIKFIHEEDYRKIRQ
jgi:HD-GYP domain-containing protein (c-di-GMP phosphodiesterase class II)